MIIDLGEMIVHKNYNGHKGSKAAFILLWISAIRYFRSWAIRRNTHSEFDYLYIGACNLSRR